jgi:hypothetical protein
MSHPWSNMTSPGSSHPRCRPRRLTLVWGASRPRSNPSVRDPLLEYAGFAPIAYRRATDRPGLRSPRHRLAGGFGSTARTRSTLPRAGRERRLPISANEVRADGDWTARAKGDDPIAAILASLGIRLSGDLVLDPSCYRITMPALDSSKYEPSITPFGSPSSPRTRPPAPSRPASPVSSSFGLRSLYWRPSPTDASRRRSSRQMTPSGWGSLSTRTHSARRRASSPAVKGSARSSRRRARPEGAYSLSGRVFRRDLDRVHRLRLQPRLPRDAVEWASGKTGSSKRSDRRRMPRPRPQVTRRLPHPIARVARSAAP